MLPRSSPNAQVEPQERARLVSRWSIAGLVIVVAAGLIFLFPRESITRSAALARPDDPLALDYLRSELAHHPADVEIRQTLVHRYARAGNIAEAQRLLKPLADNPETRHQADLARVDLQEAEIYALTPGADRTAATVRMRRLLDEIIDGWVKGSVKLDTPWVLQKLTQWEPERLGDIYQVLAQRDTAQAPQWFAKAAAAALADGQYQDAANAWFATQHTATNPQLRHQAFLQGVAALRAGGFATAAAQAAEQHGTEWLNDRDTLILLIQLARASNNPAMADRYARKLLQMAWLQRGVMWAAYAPPTQSALPRINDAVYRYERNGRIHTVSDSGPMPPTAVAANQPNAPYDAEAYALAYDVFVGNQKLADALAVATQALKSVPDDPAWMKRYAQAAEWSGQPAPALAMWQKLAKQGNSAEAWQSVFRLAPSLLDQDALLAAWEHESRVRALTDKEWLQVVNLFELIGKPLPGAEMLERTWQTRPRPFLLEQAAWLRQRDGDDAGAARNYQLLIKTYGQRVDWAITLATLRYSHSDLEGAYQALWAAHEAAPPGQVAFWHTLGDLAWYLHHTAEAQVALNQMRGEGTWQTLDAQHLLALLPDKDVLARQALLEAAWQQFHDDQYFTLALASDLDRADLAGARKWLSSLSADQRKTLEADAGFLVQRARFAQLEHRSTDAQRDIVAALALTPDANDLRVSLIWLLIERRDAATLSGVLPRWERRADGDNALADAIAAGWQSLGQLNRAVAWSRRQLVNHQQDYLWLNNYADMIDQTGQMDLAWRIRRYAWQNRDVLPPQNIDMLVARLALTLQFEPIDQARRKLYLALMQAQTPVPGDMSSGDKDRIDELIYSWHLGKDDDAAARFYYWQRHARQLSDPHYFELASAIKRDDDEAIARLLAQDGVATQPADQATMAQNAGLWPLALSLTHYNATGAPDNDAVHLALSDQLLANQAEQVNTGFSHEQGSDITGTKLLLQGTVALTPNTRLALAIDRAPLTYGPSGYSQLNEHAEVTLSLLGEANARGNGAQYSISALASKGRSSYGGFTLHAAGAEEDLGWLLEAGFNEPATDNGLLILIGKQNRLSAQGSWRINRLINGQLQLNYTRFSLQDGTRIGNKTNEVVAVQWRLPEQPYSLRGSFEAAQYSGTDASSTHYADVTPGTPGIGSAQALPQSFQRADISLGYDLENRDTFRRDFRPFGSIGAGYHSITGRQFEWLIGLGGRVSGSDRLALYGQQSTDASGGQNREWGVNYQWYY